MHGVWAFGFWEDRSYWRARRVIILHCRKLHSYGIYHFTADFDTSLIEKQGGDDDAVA